MDDGVPRRLLRRRRAPAVVVVVFVFPVRRRVLVLPAPMPRRPPSVLREGIGLPWRR